MIATLLLMQARGRVTAGEVAEELEISVATARRDLEALSAAGVPVYPQPGRGGGWSLVGGARTDLTGLTADEARALFGLLGRSDDAGPARSAVRKLLRALPSTFRDDAEAAAAAIRIDPAGWGETIAERPPLLQAVQQAIIDRNQIMIKYVNAADRQSHLAISPLGLIEKDGTWYLTALPERGEETRTYRVDRMHGVELLDRPAQRPADYDLAADWRRVSEEIESRRSVVTATALVDRRRLWAVRGYFGRHLTVLDGDQETGDHQVEDHGPARQSDDRVRVQVSSHTAESLAEQLAGWVEVLEVIEPDGVRDRLARIGAELTRRYGSGPA